ncbi:MAG TPA: hypothetical protein VFA70_01905, partial [Dehalococcoidia bacterium]|nr:hypothetical protein [Dehalococcoidia bacterium]
MPGRPGISTTRSKSNPSERYTLVARDEMIACSCKGFGYRGVCKHAEQLKNRLARDEEHGDERVQEPAHERAQEPEELTLGVTMEEVMDTPEEEAAGLPLEVAAYHEAGHAVAHVLLRRGFTEVTIVPDEAAGSAGHVTRVPLSKNYRAAAEMYGRYGPNWVGPLLWKDAITLVAGATAQERFTGLDYRDYQRETGELVSYPTGGEAVVDGDEYEAVDLLWRLAGDPDKTGELWHQTREAAVELWQDADNWAAVEALAKALLEHKRLSGRQA